MQTVWRDDERFVETYWKQRSRPAGLQHLRLGHPRRGRLLLHPRPHRRRDQRRRAPPGHARDRGEHLQPSERRRGRGGRRRRRAEGPGGDGLRGRRRTPARAGRRRGRGSQLEGEIMKMVDRAARRGGAAVARALRQRAAQDALRQAAAPGDPGGLREPRPGRPDHDRGPGALQQIRIWRRWSTPEPPAAVHRIAAARAALAQSWLVPACRCAGCRLGGFGSVAAASAAAAARPSRAAFQRFGPGRGRAYCGLGCTRQTARRARSRSTRQTPAGSPPTTISSVARGPRRRRSTCCRNVHPDKADARRRRRPASCAGSDFGSSLGQNEVAVQGADAAAGRATRSTRCSLHDAAGGVRGRRRQRCRRQSAGARSRSTTASPRSARQFDATSATRNSSWRSRSTSLRGVPETVWKRQAKRDDRGPGAARHGCPDLLCR